MIGVVLTAFNILLLLFVWQVFLKKTILDTHRDQLFDLRCQLRKIFSEHQALDSRAYVETRKLLNAQIALTENLSILQYVLWKKFTKSEVIKQQLAEQGSSYRIDNDELQQAVRKIRSDASYVCSSYMILSSLTLTITVFLTAFVMGVCWIFKNVFRNFGSVVKVAFNESAYAKLWEGAVSKTHIDQDMVEDASLILMKKA
ncbi:hypothetical protein JZM37_13805 [Acinetobacter pittii]|uniref:hypothetical protein n=1 Tax=Acinetobacter pittii TaxID=48296 RepID=UPI0019812D6B|nr:hypothetical protein [Acinetobacter pittii]MBN6525313.1 hypothetical protein [Acinetobacter pittii]